MKPQDAAASPELDLSIIAQVLPTTPFQVGALVRNLDEAMTLHTALGVTDWVTSGWRTGEYYDRAQDAVLSPNSRVAFGRLTPDLSIELIELDPTGPRPAVWDIDADGPTAHVGYWVEDSQPIASKLIAAGGTLMLAKATMASLLELDPEPRPRDWVPDELDACYISMGNGLLVELVPEAIWETRLPDGFGADVAKAIPAPPNR